MKRIILPLVCLTVFSASAYDLHTKALTPITEQAKPAGAAMAFVKAGKCDFSINYDTKHAECRKAAKLLEDVFAAALPEKPVYCGKYSITLKPSTDPLEQKLSVATTSEGIVLGGNVWYAALDFCERFLGCRWYFPGDCGTIIPALKDLVIKPVAYEDEPYFRGYRGDRFYPYTSVENASRRDHWKPYTGDIDPKKVSAYLDYWRTGGRGVGAGGHSPRPECIAKSHPDKLETIFYKSPYGKFYYNPGGHVGNAFNVLDFGFADLLIEDWKAYYASKGKDDRGGFGGALKPDSCSFGVCDTYIPISDVITHPLVKKLDLVKESDLKRDVDAGMCNIYARFYQYLGNRLKKEMPDKQLFLLIYYNSKNASLDPRWKLPDNIEVNVCDGRLPGKTRNAAAMEKTKTLFREWYEALGNRPAMKAWLYAARFNRFGRAVMPEFIGDVPKILGKYLNRDGAVFYDYDGGQDLWHYFYSAYCGVRAQWNPELDCDAAVDEMMELLCGAEAGAYLKKFHRDLKNAYIEYCAKVESSEGGQIPRSVVETFQADLAAAKKCLKEGTIEMRRYNLIADYWPTAFETQLALADYEPPVYEVKRYSKDLDWSKLTPMPLVEFKSGAAPKIPAYFRLAWDEEGLHGRFEAPYAPRAEKAKDMWSNDSVELIFTPGLKKEVEYQLAYDCFDRQHVQKQRFLPIPQPPDASFSAPGFRHESKIGAAEWKSEFFIPWTLFEEGAPKVYDSWNANFVRTKFSEPFERTSSAFTLGNNHKREMFGILRFVGKGD